MFGFYFPCTPRMGKYEILENRRGGGKGEKAGRYTCTVWLFFFFFFIVETGKDGEALFSCIYEHDENVSNFSLFRGLIVPK